jgi:hypothetical protein
LKVALYIASFEARDVSTVDLNNMRL